MAVAEADFFSRSSPWGGKGMQLTVRQKRRYVKDASPALLSFYLMSCGCESDKEQTERQVERWALESVLEFAPRSVFVHPLGLVACISHVLRVAEGGPWSAS